MTPNIHHTIACPVRFRCCMQLHGHDLKPLLLLWLVAILVLPSPSRAAEPWSDPRLDVHSGLFVWLDAQALPRASQAAGLPAVESNAPLGIWWDASGQRRHLTQRSGQAQPIWLQAVGRNGQMTMASVRFDGQSQFMQTTGLKTSLEHFDLYIVAAPRTNPGFYRAMLAANALGLNDYVSGFNLDLGSRGTNTMEVLNIEGRGFGGERNLLAAPQQLEHYHRIRITCAEPGTEGIRVEVDELPPTFRERQPGRIGLDEMTVGARFFSNSALPPFVQGFFDGEIAEVLLYDRVLSSEESQRIQRYLEDKHRALLQSEAADLSELWSGWKMPSVQFLEPGFVVRKLPIDIINTIDLQYDAQGRLVALGYDGRVRVLTDADGDGLEDDVSVWWDEPLIMPMAMLLDGDSVLVATRGRIVRLSDSDDDGLLDDEQTVVTGWSAPQNYSGGVDALGLTRDSEGNLYFGLGTSDYARAYLLDEQGKSQYRVDGDRGTIKKFSPATGKMETVCTGVRFTVGLAVNRHGDLFASDQEGATWLPNGNPFDELLHIQPGRHYGFPPRHPRHLPEVIDEPSTFDYAPQHQSTCGLTFNRLGNDACFGPLRWFDDALVAGYSRGKLYRTQLVKTRSGYVARTSLLAALRELTVDTCIGPDGSLIIATHSGNPDWGSGPSGKGMLYKVTSAPAATPRPVITWAGPADSGIREVRVALDQPLDPEQLKAIATGARLQAGRFVRAGDRFETKRPGYAVVQQQAQEQRNDVPIHSIVVTPDRRTIALRTDPLSADVHYALSLPWTETVSALAGALPQQPVLEVDFALHGVEAQWQSQQNDSKLSAWLPHVNLDVTRSLTAASIEHEQFLEQLVRPGRLVLNFQADIHNMLRPEVQPGSRLDAELPPEQVTLVFQANHRLRVQLANQWHEGTRDGTTYRVEVPCPSSGDAAGQRLPVTIETDTSSVPPELDLTWKTAEDNRLRPWPLHRSLLPGVRQQGADAPSLPVAPPQLAGGRWQDGHALFFGQAQCGKCHQMYGRGGRIGPDLSNLRHRDYQSVLRDIVEPSGAINPDHLSYNVVLHNGKLLTGTVRLEDERYVIGDAKGEESRVTRDDVDQILPQPRSTMPDNLLQSLSSDQQRHLMTFLLLPRPRLPEDLSGAPPDRSRAEVLAVLDGANENTDSSRPLNVVLVAGPKDHGPGEHDYPAWLGAWSTLLRHAENVNVQLAWPWPTPQQWETADVVVLYQHGTWHEDKAQQLDRYLERGGGLVYIHFAVDGGAELAKRIGLAWGAGAAFRHGPLELVFDQDVSHPVTRGFARLSLLDESYWNLTGDPADVQTLASGIEQQQPRPLFWARKVGKGRVFVSIPGHYSWTFDDPVFRTLLLRGILWSAREQVDRWNDLVWIDARVERSPDESSSP